MKDVCLVCGALFVEGQGFMEPHYTPCFNEEHGTAWVIAVDNHWSRPAKVKYPRRKIANKPVPPPIAEDPSWPGPAEKSRDEKSLS